MSNNEKDNSDNNGPVPIPKEVQEISTGEIIKADYEVVPPMDDDSEDVQHRERVPPMGPPPGRTYNDDSIDASSEGADRTEDGYSFTAGYDSSMATRIGTETSDDAYADRLRELHEGRHQSDGEHSVRESQRDKKRLAQAITSPLPLASHERDKVIHIVQNIDYTRFGQQKGIVGVTLGVVAVVIDERVRSPKSLDEVVARSDEFRGVCDSNDISMSDLTTIKEKVREALEEGAVHIIEGEGMVKRDPALPGPTPLKDRPDDYWENLSAEYWALLAKNWDNRLIIDKDAIPEEYRERIDQLRRWAPWEDEKETPEPDQQISESMQEDPTDRPLLEEIEEEVEELLAEMGEYDE